MEHTCTDECLVEDIYDGGDDGDGYVAYPMVICKVTGGTWDE